MKLSPLIAYTATKPRRVAFFAAAYLIGCAVWLYYKHKHRPRLSS